MLWLIAALLVIPVTGLMAQETIQFGETMQNFLSDTGIVKLFAADNWKNLVMIGIACLLSYLAIVKQYEPLLLLPIAFGMLLTNFPGAGLFHSEF